MIFWDENGQMIHMCIYSSSTFYFNLWTLTTEMVGGVGEVVVAVSSELK